MFLDFICFMPLEFWLLMALAFALIAIACVVQIRKKAIDYSEDNGGSRNNESPLGAVAIHKLYLENIKMTYVYTIPIPPGVIATSGTCPVMDDIELTFCLSSEYFRYLIYCEFWIKMLIVFGILQKCLNKLAKHFVCLCHLFFPNAKITRAATSERETTA